MKRIVKVSSWEFKLTYPSSHYVHNYDDYNIDCDIINRNLGILHDTYVLKIEGKAENIQLYLDYLKCSGFKIH